MQNDTWKGSRDVQDCITYTGRRDKARVLVSGDPTRQAVRIHAEKVFRQVATYRQAFQVTGRSLAILVTVLDFEAILADGRMRMEGPRVVRSLLRPCSFSLPSGCSARLPVAGSR